VEPPPVVRAQLDELTTEFRTALGDGLGGIYVHASLALGWGRWPEWLRGIPISPRI